MNWVLVTGAPRSGTTFVGKVLSFPMQVDYIHEPFNPECGMQGFEVRYPYTREGLESEPEIRSRIEQLLAYKIKLRTVYYSEDTLTRRVIKRLAGGRGVNMLRLAKWNPTHRHAVVKDPFACLLADYLSRQYGVRSVVLVRHPVAFAAAVRRMGWDVNKGLKAIGANSELMHDHFKGEHALLRPGATVVESAARLWRALNKVMIACAARNPLMKIITHESVSASPLEQFEQIYSWAGIPWRERYREKILRLTSANNPVEARGQRQQFRRKSSELLRLRLRQMSREHTGLVWEITRDIAAAFYDEPV